MMGEQQPKCEKMTEYQQSPQLFKALTKTSCNNMQRQNLVYNNKNSRIYSTDQNNILVKQELENVKPVRNLSVISHTGSAKSYNGAVPAFLSTHQMSLSSPLGDIKKRKMVALNSKTTALTKRVSKVNNSHDFENSNKKSFVQEKKNGEMVNVKKIYSNFIVSEEQPREEFKEECDPEGFTTITIETPEDASVDDYDSLVDESPYISIKTNDGVTNNFSRKNMQFVRINCSPDSDCGENEVYNCIQVQPQSWNTRKIFTSAENSIECKPLDLSLEKTSVQSPHDIKYRPPVKKAKLSEGLLSLADAASYLEQNEQVATYSASTSRSSPASTSTYSVYEEQAPEEFYCEPNEEGYLIEPRGMAFNDLNLKCERGEKFQEDGIVLNSNSYFSHSLQSPSETVVYRDDGMDVIQTNFLDSESDYTYSGSNSPQYSMVCDSVYSPETCLNSNGYVDGGVIAPDNTPPAEGKRRMRLNKSDYDNMTAEARKSRHRDLDNHRSKQYRERKRMYLSTLAAKLTEAENKNHYLQSELENLRREKHFLMKLILDLDPAERFEGLPTNNSAC